MTSLTDRAQRIQPDLVALRRALHREPELGLRVPRTQSKVLAALAGLPLEITTGQGCTSVTAVLRGAHPGPTVLLRGDMDALPIQENNDLDYASQVPGRMHACGHDMHTAGLVGAARLLTELRDDLHGQVVFMFQPGEEGDRGAGVMLDEGILTAAGRPVDFAFAMHVIANRIPHGVIATKPGPAAAASDRLAITVKGRGGHGAYPHTALDPVPVLCEIVLAMQGFITRRFDVFDPVVLTVGHLAAGAKANVIPSTAVLEATVRSYSEANHARLQRELPALAAGIAAAHGIEAQCDYHVGYPVLVNDATETAYALNAARSLFGPGQVFQSPIPATGSEDFALVLQRVPGTMMYIGASPAGSDLATAPTNHSPQAIFDDAVLWRQAALLTELALGKLGRPGSGAPV
ncbi:M20 metallopeptidase family protein [Nocardia tengchongensis]|uniref:M20 metallopeptidase family protein n=1 Tax=Nocardia tengchongensis TaxID=2055889 RepID=UPI0036A4D1EE